MKIHIITTGGTIEGLDYTLDKDAPKNIPVQIKKFLESANISSDYSIENAFSKDSRFITEEDRRVLIERIKATTDKHILITHGTYTMVETAKYLGLQNLNKKIVLVGSFILGTKKNTDAPFNLGFALGALHNVNDGVYIAMNGKVFTWDNISKNVELNRFETNA